MDPQVPQPSSPSPVPPPPQTSKLPVIIGVFLLLGLVSAGSYILGTKSSTNIIKVPMEETNGSVVSPSSTLTSETNEIANWKTYINTEYEYSFKYPKNAQLFDDLQHKPFNTMGCVGILSL